MGASLYHQLRLNLISTRHRRLLRRYHLLRRPRTPIYSLLSRGPGVVHDKHIQLELELWASIVPGFLPHICIAWWGLGVAWEVKGFARSAIP